MRKKRTESVIAPVAGKPLAVNILPLGEAPEYIPILARWFHQEWFYFDGRAPDAIAAQLRQNLAVDRIPITFIAQSGSSIVGTVSIDLLDLPPFDNLSPWLASLYVVPEARRAGIGSALVKHAQEFAQTRGIGLLHLWTPNKTSVYGKCGWTEWRRTIYKSRAIRIMRYITVSVPHR